uniref:Uncharacterized protein n=1 Tax=Rhizophora mucronata TaxID=61149 RepID=A0A2P2NHI2_RHIMU
MHMYIQKTKIPYLNHEHKIYHNHHREIPMNACCKGISTSPYYTLRIQMMQQSRWEPE